MSSEFDLPSTKFGSSGYDSGSSSGNSGSLADKELQSFIELEQQRAQLQTQIHSLTEVCWDKCTPDRPSTKLDARTETCISNCVNRFIDVSNQLVGRMTQIIEKQGVGQHA